MLTADLQIIATTLTQVKKAQIEKNIKFSTVAKSTEVKHMHPVKKVRKAPFFMRRTHTARM